MTNFDDSNFGYHDEQLFDIAHNIERSGYATISVNTGECIIPGCHCWRLAGPTWTYSIGMLEHGHPEVVVVGEASERAFALLDLAYRWHHLGAALPLGRDARSLADGAVVTTVPVPKRCWFESDLMAFWHNYYRSIGCPALDGIAVPVVQLVVADATGCFPWEAACDPDFRDNQPIIEDDDSAWPRDRRAARRSRQRSNRRRGRR